VGPAAPPANAPQLDPGVRTIPSFWAIQGPSSLKDGSFFQKNVVLYDNHMETLQ